MTIYNLPLPGLEELAPGVWRYPGDTERTAYLGSIRSSKFHRPTCWHGQRILPSNQICFQDGEAAVNYGYAPCEKCKPLQDSPEKTRVLPQRTPRTPRKQK